MKDSSLTNTELLHLELTHSRPMMILGTDKSGKKVEKFDDDYYRQRTRNMYEPLPENHIQKTVKRYIPSRNRNQVDEFSHFYLKHFFGDLPEAYEDIIKNLSSHELWQSKNYLLFFENLIIDAAAVGFPSIAAPFAHHKQEEALELSGRSLFDTRNILALRIYLADLLLQTAPRRMEALHKVSEELKSPKNTDASESQKNIQKIPFIFGKMPKIKEGKVADADIPITYEVHPLYEDTLPYDRQLYHGLYLPDLESATALVKLGEMLGRQRFSPRGAGLDTIAAMTKEKATIIFPDFTDASIKVHPDHVDFIQKAFGLSYTDARNLLRAEFEREDHPSKNGILHKIRRRIARF